MRKLLIVSALIAICATLTAATLIFVDRAVARERALLVPVKPTPLIVWDTPDTPSEKPHIAPTQAVTPTATPTPMPTPTPTPEPWAHPLTDEEYAVVCAIVMGEAGGEPYDGQLAVAQCIREGCAVEGIEPSELREKYKYAGYNPNYTESVERAVTAVFRDGDGVTEETILFFYAPKVCGHSAWHESQRYILTIGGHKFFAQY